jgi:hypothetical protein
VLKGKYRSGERQTGQGSKQADPIGLGWIHILAIAANAAMAMDTVSLTAYMFLVQAAPYFCGP